MRNKQVLGQVTYGFSFENLKILTLGIKAENVLAYTLANLKKSHTGLRSSIFLWTKTKSKF